MKAYLIIILIFCLGCVSKTKKSPPSESAEIETKKESKTEKSDFYVKFTKVDNRAHVYIDDSLIYKSDYTLGGANEVAYEVDISSYINNSEKLKVVLYNGVEPYDEQVDTYWEIMYDLILDGEVVDFIHEQEQENIVGVAFESEY
ncbi:MAG: hypothetical protein RLP12_03980, partial [Ekhidna sp.]